MLAKSLHILTWGPPIIWFWFIVSPSIFHPKWVANYGRGFFKKTLFALVPEQNDEIRSHFIEIKSFNERSMFKLKEETSGAWKCITWESGDKDQVTSALFWCPECITLFRFPLSPHYLWIFGTRNLLGFDNGSHTTNNKHRHLNSPCNQEVGSPPSRTSEIAKNRKLCRAYQLEWWSPRTLIRGTYTIDRCQHWQPPQACQYACAHFRLGGLHCSVSVGKTRTAYLTNQNN